MSRLQPNVIAKAKGSMKKPVVSLPRSMRIDEANGTAGHRVTFRASNDYYDMNWWNYTTVDYRIFTLKK